tara:strand:- start:1775 stop:4051 length:2277 start_codon:yes stop_codon:yes gene_type:complete
MAKASPAFTNFTAGELSPRLDGRTDIAKYFNGCKKLQNFVVHPHGGASRRPGTIFVREVKNSAHNCRLIPFEFNVTQTYILEFGDDYFRVHKDGGTVVDGSSNPIEVTTPYAHTDLAKLKFTQSADVMYLVHPDFSPRKITRTSHTSWSITEVNFLRGPMSEDNTSATTLVANGRTGSVTITASTSTFVSSDVGRLVRVHDGFAKITAYSSGTSVTATVQENVEGRAELMPSFTATTISFHEGDPSTTALEHNDRIQDSSGQFVSQGFKVGMKVTISGASTSNNNESSAIVVKVTDDTILLAPSSDLTDEAAGQSVTVAGILTASTDWALGAFSAATGYPAAVAFYEQRLVFASTTTQPQTLFFSVGGSFEDFSGGVDADDALTYTLGSNQVNIIRYLQAGRVLLVGTSGGEFVVTSSEDAPLSPTNAVVKRQATYGSADIQPVQVANVTLFVQRAKRKLRELVFDLNTDSYQAPDMTILAEHITEGGIKEMSLQQEPDNVVWCVLENGKFAGMTYRREENVIAWHEHLIGGVFGSDAFGHVETVATVPGDLNEDDTYVVVKRTIGGATKRYVEYFSSFEFGDDVEDAFFVDSGLTYSGSAATSISGLNHLEGQSVSILANGATHPNKTVSSGAISLDFSVTKAHIGLGFDSTLQTMRIEAGGTEGTAQGKTKRIHEVVLRLFRTVGVKVGSSETELDRIPFRSSAQAMTKAIPLFTGDKEIEFRGGFDTDGFVVIQQDQPLPLTVIGIFPRLITFDQ